MAVSTSGEQAVDYRYFVCDLLTNEVLAEIPFKSVSYSRSLVEAGTFTGDIPVIEDTYNLDLYATTLPGKTALYIVRNGLCVWGGIIWGRTYSLIDKVLSVSAAEFTSYFEHRVVWKTWSSSYEASAVVNSGIATVTLTNGQYDFEVGEAIWLDWGTDYAKYSGYFTVSTVSTTADDRSIITTEAKYVDATKVEKTIPTLELEVMTLETRQDTYKFAKDLLRELNTDLFDFDFANDDIRPGIEFFNQMSQISRSSNVASVRTNRRQELVPGQKIEISDVKIDGGSFNNKEAIVLDIIDDYNFTYASTGSNVSTTILTGVDAIVSGYSITNYIAEVTTTTNHGLDAGDIVYIENVSDLFGGFQLVNTKVSDTVFTVVTTYATNLAASATDSTSTTYPPKVSRWPAVTYSTYGEFTTLGDIGLDLSRSDNQSQTLQSNPIIRGYELATVADVLNDYATRVNGFEYRVDCEFDTSTNSFKKYLMMLPLVPSSVDAYITAEEEWDGSLPPSAFGADQTIFEYPGNVLEAQFEENAEESATRFFVQGKDPNLSSDASQPYSAASNYNLLREGWPILDQTETLDAVEEVTLWQHASRLLEESLPPMSTFSISVNGSANPTLGTYSPGDWCTVIMNDPFVGLRAASSLEQNYGTEGVLVRKIISYDVSVPDTPSYPESVTLELVIEPAIPSSTIEVLSRKAYSGD